MQHVGAAAELRDLTGVWAAVRYLVAVGGTQTGLVKKHAGWILTVDPEAGLEMFTEMQPALPPDSVLPILAAHAPSLCATYLESAIAQGSVSAQVRLLIHVQRRSVQDMLGVLPLLKAVTLINAQVGQCW